MNFSEKLKDKFKQAQKIAVLTGAGISAESGVPTFRGADGLWKQYRAEELATPAAFAKQPALVWEWYAWRRGKIAAVKPNPGHYALAELEKKIPAHFTLITQNVDGLHRQAGSQNILELHGNIWRVRCLKEGKVSYFEEDPLKEIPPHCACGSLLRPDIVWFGESLPEEVLDKAFAAAHNCDFFMSIGTSALVQPAASLPLIAKDNGAFVVEINKESTPISSVVDECLLGLAGEILPELVALRK